MQNRVESKRRSCANRYFHGLASPRRGATRIGLGARRRSPLYACNGFSADSRKEMFLLNPPTGNTYAWKTAHSEDVDEAELDGRVKSVGMGFLMAVGVWDGPVAHHTRRLPSTNMDAEVVAAGHRAPPLQRADEAALQPGFN